MAYEVSFPDRYILYVADEPLETNLRNLVGDIFLSGFACLLRQNVYLCPV